MPYNPSMPANPIGPRLQRIGARSASRMPLAPASTRYYNAGVNAYARSSTRVKRLSPLTHTQYYNAGVLMAYGKTDEAYHQLGDLFNDIMGAVVPGWDQRPDFLKKIVIKPDPSKLIQTAQQVAPDAAGKVVSTANKYGLNVFVNTPAGQVPVSPDMAQGLYAGYPMFAQAQQTLSNIPTWVWMAGGGVVLLMLVGMMRR